MKNWKSRIRKACQKIEADPEAYWLNKYEQVGNILIKSNVYSGQFQELGTAVYQIPLYRIMYKTERDWLFNCGDVEQVINLLQEKLDFSI